MEAHDETLDLNAEQTHAAEAVAALPKADPPSGLAARTLARVVESQPVKRVFWMLRPITSPIVRIAVAALIIMSIVPLADVDIATSLGKRIQEKIIGERVTERVERIVDGLLAYQGGPNFSSPADLEPFGPEERLQLKRVKPRQGSQPEA
jgi:hypothetical protein